MRLLSQKRTPTAGTKGFTLIETLVGLSLVSMVASALGMVTFHALGTAKGVVDEGIALSELRRGLAWFAEDAVMAQTATVSDGGAPSTSLTVGWVDSYAGASVSHSITYSLSGTKLVRTFDGVTSVVANHVSAVSFSRIGPTLTAEAQVTRGRSTPRTVAVQAVMRPVT